LFFRAASLGLLATAKGEWFDSRGKHCTDYTSDITYALKPGYINFNIKYGYAKLAYTTIPVDFDGYPLVPDLASVSEAIYWYITTKLLYPKYIMGEIPQTVYHDTRRLWVNWQNKAYAEIISGNYDTQTSDINIWNSIYPNMREEQTFGDTIGQSQEIYDDDRRFGNVYIQNTIAYD
jgi:hypothetical protein